MGYDTKKDTIFPTRSGEAQGGAAERQMLDAVGGVDGFRTRIQDNRDGSSTLMRTKDGMPQFVTSKPKATEEADVRGFTARLPGKGVGFRINFSGWSLSKVTSWVGQCYAVAAARSTINAAASSMTLWDDVWLALRGMLYVNIKQFKSTWSLIEHIPFIVGSYTTYKRWLVGKRQALRVEDNTAFPLTPTLPYTENRALVGGQWLSSGASETPVVGMAQIWFSGLAWNDDGGDWGYSSSVYDLTQTTPAEVHQGHSLDIVSGGFVHTGTSGSGEDSQNLGSVPLNANASFSVQSISYFTSGNHGPYRIAYGNTFAGWVQATVRGRYVYNYTGHEWEDAVSETLTLTPTETATVTASNVFLIRDKSGTTYFEADASLPPKPLVTSIEIRLDDSGQPYEYGRGTSISGGGDTWWYNLQIAGWSGTSRRDKEQVLTASVTIGLETLLSLEGTYSKPSGQYANFTPIELGPMDGLDVHYSDVFVAGILPESPLGMSVEEANAWTMEKTTLISQAVTQAAAEISGQSGYFGIQTLISFPRVTQVTTSLSGIGTFSQSWTTKDYFIYDKAEEVYGWITGSCTGSGTDAGGPCTQTLTVTLHLTCRGNHYTKELGTWTFNSADLFALIEVDNTVFDATCIPTPVIRPFFLPPVRHQGAFSGMAYTTLHEEAAGATPHSLFNFRMRLHMLGFVGPELTSEQGTNILNFIPYLLVEMLYGTIYSHWLGAHPDYRYPVFNSAAYNTLANSLFDTETHVHLIDGVDVDWASSVSSTFTNKTATVEVFRS